MHIEMNSVEEARGAYATELQNWGYNLPTATDNADQDAHNILVDYWNARARRIDVRPRTVHWSPELRAREPGPTLRFVIGVFSRRFVSWRVSTSARLHAA